MKVYSISGYCGEIESGEVRLVHNVYATREKAEAVLADMMEETRVIAQEAEAIKGFGNDKGMWTEEIAEVHGSKFVIKRYKCVVSVDLCDAEGLEMFRKASVVGLLEAKGFKISDGIHVDNLYSALSFNIASLTLSVQEL